MVAAIRTTTTRRIFLLLQLSLLLLSIIALATAAGAVSAESSLFGLVCNIESDGVPSNISNTAAAAARRKAAPAGSALGGFPPASNVVVVAADHRRQSEHHHAATTTSSATKSTAALAAASTLRGGGGGRFFFIPAGWNPLGYKITPLGEECLKFHGALEGDLGRFLASLKASRKRTKALKASWLEIVRASKTGQAMRIYRNLDDFILFSLRAGLID